ncbi:MAG: PKD domain-containing protein [Bacteroidetes bacterium OLB10]|nr:MAG: PKD domain-containing protein [Bacteroidetes bacterium OLB10]
MKRILLFSAVFLFFILKGTAQTLPPLFLDQLVSAGWDEVEGFVNDSTGQNYVWEKAGIVWVVDTNGNKLAQPLIDISDEVGNWRDHGLNGFALDPHFRTNGYFYLFYVVDLHYLLYYGTPTYDPDSNQYNAASIARVTRYTADPATNFTTTIPGSRFVLLGETKQTGIPVLYDTHSGGSLVFATDGTLFVSTGDGASPATADSGQISPVLSYWPQALADSIITPEENVGAYRSQMIQSLNGKLLRLDPATGDGMPTNPFYDPLHPRSPQSRVWALGLRNPFRIILKPGTGESDPTAGNPGTFYIGDVGWQFWEDINVCNAPGMNFGWPVYQGFDLDPNYFGSKQYNFYAPNPLYGTGGCTQKYFTFHDLIQNPTQNGIVPFLNPCDNNQSIPPTVLTFVHARPVIDYYHGNESRTGIFVGNNASQIDIDDPSSPVDGVRFGGYTSVSGLFYQGNKFPLDMQGSYFHGDYAGEWIKRFDFNSNDTATLARNFGDNMGAVVYMRENQEDGCIYYVRYPDQIRRICYGANVNNTPYAIASADTNYGASPLTVQFDGSQSYDPDGDPLTYSWNFGDGFTSTLINPQHTFTVPGGVVQSYWVELTVTDTAGNFAKDSVLISINNTPPVVDITSFNDGDLYSMLQSTILPLQATVTDAEHGPSQLHYKWNVYFHHNQHEHPEPTDTNRVTTATLLPVGCDGEIYYYRIRLTVTDDGGLSGYDEKNVYPNCTTDCNGDFNGTAFIDSCGTCVGGNTGLTACTQDCNGVWGGTAFIDSCNTCVGGNTGLTACTQDCNGVWGGTAFIDSCNTCVGGNTGLTACTQDCNGVWGGTAYIDSCGTCVGGNTGLFPCGFDCNGDWGGTAYIDSCGICVGGNTGLTACIQDCNGDWGGTAYFDTCGICVGGNTGIWDCDTVNAVQNFASGHWYKLYPNPVMNNYIIIESDISTLDIELTDMLGKLIITQRCDNFGGKCKIDVSAIQTSGIYAVRIIRNHRIMSVIRIAVMRDW